jgi:hypothetical protein
MLEDSIDDEMEERHRGKWITGNSSSVGAIVDGREIVKVNVFAT